MAIEKLVETLVILPILFSLIYWLQQPKKRDQLTRFLMRQLGIEQH